MNNNPGVFPSLRGLWAAVSRSALTRGPLVVTAVTYADYSHILRRQE